MDDGRLRGRRRGGVAARMRIALSAISRRRILLLQHLFAVLGDVGVTRGHGLTLAHEHDAHALVLTHQTRGYVPVCPDGALCHPACPYAHLALAKVP